ncbi:OPT superfamily oligopeptide transporter [Serendipita vermifera]|nr:OPT superfamily oligopeptide transporter [Serendipita vermifera]
MSIQSALLGRLLGAFFKRPFTPEENVVLQTTAVATGTMPLAAGFVGIIPALGLLEMKKDGAEPIKFTWIKAAIWSLGIAFFGVFLAVPLRKQTIIKEKLAFPSGTATAQLISVLYEKPLRVDASTGELIRGEAVSTDDREPISPRERRAEEEHLLGEDVETAKDLVEKKNGWKPLGWSFSAALFITVLSHFFPVIFAIPLFGVYLAREWLWYFTPSLSYVGQGVIMGFSTTVSMNLGMFVGWAVLAPLAKHSGWAPGHIGDMSTGGRGWILWVALAIMTADSLVSLAPVTMEIISELPVLLGLKSSSSRESGSSEEVEPPSRLVPIGWVVTGLLLSVTAGTIIVWILFGNEGIKPWATILGFVLGGAMSLLGVRALGETDLNPVSGLGKISQLFFAAIQPGNVVANIIAGGVAEAGAQQAGDLMQDFKTGHLVGASPRAQFQGQIVGSLISVLVTTTAFSLYSRTYQIPGPNFPAPTAYVWLNLARLLRSSSLPAHVGEFMISFGLLAAVVSGVKVWASTRPEGKPWVKWVPSGVAFAIGMLNTPNFSLARLVGGCLELAWRHRKQSSARPIWDLDEDHGDDDETHANHQQKSDVGELALIIVASGFVLGEGVGSIVNLVIKMFGVDQATCWGCVERVCGGCP